MHSASPVKHPGLRCLEDLAGSVLVSHVEGYRDVMSASLEEWWPRLSQETRDWLIANNGDTLTASVIEEITRAGGSVRTNAWWVGQDGPTGFYLSDEAVDWVETVANGEVPEPRGDG